MKEVIGVKLYTTAEAGTLLGVTAQTVIKYIKNGKLSSQRIGGKNYISEESIKKFVLAES